VTPVLSFDEARRHEHIVARQVVTDLNGIVQPSPAPRFSRTDPGTPAPPPSRAIEADAVITEWRNEQARQD
jgi:alpha-methylacyl-CoA racemase